MRLPLELYFLESFLQSWSRILLCPGHFRKQLNYQPCGTLERNHILERACLGDDKKS